MANKAMEREQTNNEFTEAQIERQDELCGAAYEFACVMAENPNGEDNEIEDDMEYIGEIIDAVMGIMLDMKVVDKVYYPYETENDKGETVFCDYEYPCEETVSEKEKLESLRGQIDDVLLIDTDDGAELPASLCDALKTCESELYHYDNDEED